MRRTIQVRNFSVELWIQVKAAAILNRQTLAQWVAEACVDKLIKKK